MNMKDGLNALDITITRLEKYFNNQQHQCIKSSEIH